MNSVVKQPGSSRPKNKKGNKKRTKTKRPMQKSQRQRQNARLGRAELAPCARTYLKILTDPCGHFPAYTPDFCIPDDEAEPSFKVKSRVRGIGVIGTSGVGFVTVEPDVYANNVNMLSVSAAAFAGTAASCTAAAGSVLLVTDANQPYTAAQAVLGRTVAAGLRVRFIGTNLNQSGIVVPFSAPKVSVPLGDFTADTLLTNPTCERFNFDRQWRGCIYRDKSPNARLYTIGTSAVTNANNSMGIFMTGVAGQSFEYEFVSYREYITNTASVYVQNTSQSHSDPIGYGVAADFIAQISGSEIGQGLLNQAVKFVSSASLNMLTGFSGGLSFTNGGSYSVPTIEYL